MNSPLHITVHGIRILIESESATITEWLEFDFAKCTMEAFSEAPHIKVTVLARPPVSASIPPIPESNHSPEYVTYKAHGVRYIDYYGRVLSIYNDKEESAVFYSLEDHYLYEKVYLFILSRLGEMLDFKGLHRIHALGFTYRDIGVLYLIPMRGGKSTLALSLASQKDCELCSDDAPLINHSGEIVPFPFRLGVREQEPTTGIPEKMTRLFIRKNKDSKVLIHPNAVENWAKEAKACHAIFVGRWTKAPHAQIKEISPLRLWRTLFRDCVIGLGLPQVVEFFIKSNLTDIANKIMLVTMRTVAITKLALKARGYEFHVTPDIAANRAVLMAKLQEISGR